ncbi:MAG: energy transducer TonB, partial [Acetobacteraceae bacterium]|nr:energy transducer TonB [Acetobacteraceae bacterium]
MRGDRLNLWLAVSAALHLVVVLFLLLDLVPRKLPEPQEQAIAVELVAPTELAQGEQPAPVPAPVSVPAPPSPQPPATEPP